MHETSKLKQRICFIINPVSGRLRHKNIVGQINDGIDKQKFEISIKFTEAGGHAKLLCQEALENKFNIIVAVGGDGTINEVASQMLYSECILGIIPGGSGNGLARHLDIPLSVKKAIQLINESYHIKIDTAKVNDQIFISIAGIGFDALVAKEFAGSKKRGFITYSKIVATRFLKYKPKKYKLTFEDGTVIKTRALFIAFANSNQFGYNTQIAPNALLNDGKLDICIAQKPPLVEMPIIANLMLLKKIDKSPHVLIIQSSSVIVERSRNSVVNIDGEPMKIKTKLNVKVEPQSLNIIIPKNGQKR